MSIEKVSLTIEGAPGAEVEVIPRTPTDPPPDPVYTGKLDEKGHVTVSIPRGYYVVRSPGYNTEPVHLDSTQTVQLKKHQS